jgi:hypothetical protein
MIDQSRGTLALQKFFTEAYQGTLVSDFWAAYDLVWAADRQMPDHLPCGFNAARFFAYNF